MQEPLYEPSGMPSPFGLGNSDFNLSSLELQPHHKRGNQRMSMRTNLENLVSKRGERSKKRGEKLSTEQ